MGEDFEGGGEIDVVEWGWRWMRTLRVVVMPCSRVAFASWIDNCYSSAG